MGVRSMTSFRDASLPSLLVPFVRRIFNGAGLDDSLRVLTETALDWIPCDHASIRMVDASGVRLTVGARSGRGAHLSVLPLKKGEGIAGWVLETGKAVRVDDAAADPRFTVASGQGFTIGSMLAEPLLSGGHVVGVLSVSASSVRAFSPEDELLLRLLACCAMRLVEHVHAAGLATTDELTDALREDQLGPSLDAHIARSNETRAPLSVLIIDVDGLDRVNERFSRDVGDRVLRVIANRVRARARAFDVIVRRAGDELVLLAASLDAERAMALAMRIDRDIRDEPIEPMLGALLTQSVSIGIATRGNDESAGSLLARAGRALQKAKVSGTTRVVMGSDQAGSAPATPTRRAARGPHDPARAKNAKSPAKKTAKQPAPHPSNSASGILKSR